MDNKKLADYLHELVRFRNNEQVQKEEFNSFTEAEANYYQDRTDAIYKLACECDSKSDRQQCSTHHLTLDEAIEHANDVADTEECEHCASEHKQLADWLSELKDIKNRYAYLAADFDNYKKRSIQRETSYSYNATKAIIKDFLRIYDDLERTVKDIESRKSSTDKMFEAYIGADKTDIGIKLVFENFEKLLQAEGCQKIKCTYGDKFDVNIMEAIAVRDIRDDEGYDPDDVVEIYQTGWKMNGPTGDVVIRPVKVVVGKEKDGIKET